METKKNIYYPPGGILMWIIIYLELITFGMALLAMVFYSTEEVGVFHESRLLLNTTLGMINTIFLLTSGFFMAESVRLFKENKKEYRKTGKVMHAWAREIDSSDTPHYHCILAFNGNKVQNPIRVFNSIVNIWSDKLKQPRPHLCKEGNHMISNTHENIFKDAFKRHSYLAKIKTKDRQPANKRNYGTSQIKPCIQKKLTG